MLTLARRLLLLVLVLAVVGTGVELLLLGHYESTVQWLPLAMVAVALPAIAWRVARQSPASVRVFAGTMVAFALVGLAGLALHFRGNVAFEMEMHPTMKELPLFWEALRGATPTLAPAMMIYTGLLGLIYHILHQSKSDS